MASSKTPPEHIPHTQEWELYHNNFSLCSKKLRNIVECCGEKSRCYKTEKDQIDVDGTDPSKNEPSDVFGQVRCHEFGGAKKTHKGRNNHPESRGDAKTFCGRVI